MSTKLKVVKTVKQDEEIDIMPIIKGFFPNVGDKVVCLGLWSDILEKLSELTGINDGDYEYDDMVDGAKEAVAVALDSILGEDPISTNFRLRATVEIVDEMGDNNVEIVLDQFVRVR